MTNNTFRANQDRHADLCELIVTVGQRIADDTSLDVQTPMGILSLHADQKHYDRLLAERQELDLFFVLYVG